MVDIEQEEVERLHPLLQTALQSLPFARRNDPRDDVEGNQAFGPAVIAIYREGDTDTVKRTLGFLALLGDLLDGSSLQPVREPLIMGTRRALGAAHLIVKGTGHGSKIR